MGKNRSFSSVDVDCEGSGNVENLPKIEQERSLGASPCKEKESE
jgi:hypothetical protein